MYSINNKICSNLTLKSFRDKFTCSFCVGSNLVNCYETGQSIPQSLTCFIDTTIAVYSITNKICSNLTLKSFRDTFTCSFCVGSNLVNSYETGQSIPQSLMCFIDTTIAVYSITNKICSNLTLKSFRDTFTCSFCVGSNLVNSYETGQSIPQSLTCFIDTTIAVYSITNKICSNLTLKSFRDTFTCSFCVGSNLVNSYETGQSIPQSLTCFIDTTIAVYSITNKICSNLTLKSFRDTFTCSFCVGSNLVNSYETGQSIPQSLMCFIDTTIAVYSITNKICSNLTLKSFRDTFTCSFCVGSNLVNSYETGQSIPQSLTCFIDTTIAVYSINNKICSNLTLKSFRDKFTCSFCVGSNLVNSYETGQSVPQRLACYINGNIAVACV